MIMNRTGSTSSTGLVQSSDSDLLANEFKHSALSLSSLRSFVCTFDLYCMMKSTSPPFSGQTVNKDLDTD